MTPTWPGGLDADAWRADYVRAADRLAQAAKAGQWPAVFALLDDVQLQLSANQWRIGGSSLFTPLHQAAWWGAPAEVVAELLRRGAWRALRTAAGDRAVDIARGRGHDHLLGALDVADPAQWDGRRFQGWDRQLAELIAERTEGLAPVAWRPVPTELIVAEELESLWCPYPGMYGGFSLSVHRERLFVESWSRIAGGSGQAHVITERGRTLVDQGFV